MILSILTKLPRLRFMQHASYSTKLPEHLVAFLENQDMIVCWHPEQKFPYEYSKPLPVKTQQKTILKVGQKVINDAFNSMKPEVAIEHLAAITYTTKHIWYPRNRDKRAKKTEMDRPYL